jgi:hypothetical protein
VSDVDDAIIRLIDACRDGERSRFLAIVERVKEKGNGVAHDDAVWREACRQIAQEIRGE